MQVAAAISNVALANTVPPPAAPTINAPNPNNAEQSLATDPKQSSGFAHLVRGFLGQDQSQSPVQPVRLQKTGSSPKSGTSTPSTTSPAQPSAPPIPPAQSPHLAALSQLIILKVPADFQSLQPSSPTTSQPETSAAQSAPVTAAVDSSAPQTASSHALPWSANLLLTPVAPLVLPEALTPPAPTSLLGNTDTANSTVMSSPQTQPQTVTSTMPQQPPSLNISVPNVQFSMDLTAVTQPPVQAQQGSTPTVRANANGAPNQTGEPVASLINKIVQLQPSDSIVTPSTSPITISAPPSSHAQLAQVAMKSALAADPSMESKPVPVAHSPAISKIAQPASGALQFSSLAPAAPPAHTNHSDSHDAASNPNGQSSSDSAPSKDDASFAQSMSSISQLLSPADNMKVAPAPADPNPALQVLAQAPVANEHSSASSTLATAPSAPLPSAPNPTDPDTGPARFVNSAQLLQSAGHSEMHISMQIDKLGNVELHARVAGDEVGATITAEKRDAHAALAVELPALQQALSDKQLRVEQVSLLHGAFHSTAGGPGAQAQQGERGTPQRPQSQSFMGGGLGPASASLAAEQTGSFDSQGRLSVHA